MKFVLESSLMHRVLTSITATFWNSPDARRFLAAVLIATGPINIRVMVDKIETYIQDLNIPESLKKELSKSTDSVGREIVDWLLFHIVKYKLSSTIPENFVWTAHGIIDRRRTAEILVHDETINTVDRFKLACLYCLEEHIFTLWSQLDENNQQEISFTPGFKQKHIVNYWSNYVKTKLSPAYPIEEISVTPFVVLNQSLVLGNETAARFFFSKITERERDDYLVEVMKALLSNYSSLSMKSISAYSQQTRTLMFLLNSMNEEQQTEILKSSPMGALKLFLEWPWQGNFMKVYHYIGQHLSEENFSCLLERVARKLDPRYRDSDYKQIFIELWVQASTTSRRYIIDTNDKFPSLLLHLLKSEDKMLCSLVMGQLQLEAVANDIMISSVIF